MKKLVQNITLAHLVLFLASFFIIFDSNFVFAANRGTDFNVGLTVTGVVDITPPSQPTALVATAVSDTQISLSWIASTDDVAVTGYRIYRDNVLIATTALLSYADSGLVSDTSYTYKVSAIDSALNESITSAVSTATTQSAPVVPSTGGGGYWATTVAPTITSATIETSLTSVLVTWNTDQDTRAVISWGKTSNAEIGSLSKSLYQKSDSATITDLLPDTTYYVTITVTSAIGGGITTVQKIFTTPHVQPEIPSVPQVPVINVGNVTLSEIRNDTPNGLGSALSLTWQNPSLNFDTVIVVRSPKFFPTDSLGGKIIYQGNSNTVVDQSIEQGVLYYYTIFVKDRLGNYSSGVGTMGGISLPSGVFSNENGNTNLTSGIVFGDLQFTQVGLALENHNDHIIVDAQNGLQINLTSTKIPANIKTIKVTVSELGNNKNSLMFLLALNKDTSSYEAMVVPPQKSGVYQTKFSLYDYKDQEVGYVNGTMTVVGQKYLSAQNNTFITYIRNNFIPILWLVLFWTFLFGLRKRRHDQEKDNQN